MAENNEEILEEQGDDLVNTIKELKTTTVAKEIYDRDISKLKDERKHLLEVIKNGGSAEEDISIDELRQNLQNGQINNLDYVANALSLREKILEEEGKDIFEAEGHTVDKQIVNGERVAYFLQGCVDKAEGNSEVFTALLSSNLTEPKGMIGKKFDD